ncbi:hypothetical protein Tco_1089715 [Tanacetum coccineum]
MAKAFKLNFSTPTNNNQRISSNPRNRQIAQPTINLGQDNQMQMVGGNRGNQFRQYAGQNVKNQVVQNLGVQNVRNQNGVIVVSGIANQNRNGNVVAARAEGNANGNNVRPRRRDAAYLQTQLLLAQKEEARIQLQAEEFDLIATAADLDKIEETDLPRCGGTIEQHSANVEETRAYHESLFHNLAAEVKKVNSQSVYQEQSLSKKINALHLSSSKQITALNEEIPNLNKQLSKEKSIVSSLQEEKKRLKSDFKIREDELLDKQIQLEPDSVQNFEIQFLKEPAKFVRDFQSLANEADESLAKHNALELEVDRLLRAFVSQDIMSIVQNNSAVDRTNDFSNPVTSNSVPTTKESKVIDNDKVIAPGIFRINPFKNSREEKFVPNKPTKASIRTNPITISQPHAIIKKAVNSDLNGFSSTGVDITTKTGRPQPRSNTKNDRVPSASKSSRIKNKEVKVEDHPRNLLLSKNEKYMSSECNNIKLVIQNDKSEIICAMCKQCLITANHDACVLNYVNGMNSHSKKQKANVSNIAN